MPFEILRTTIPREPARLHTQVRGNLVSPSHSPCVVWFTVNGMPVLNIGSGACWNNPTFSIDVVQTSPDVIIVTLNFCDVKGQPCKVIVKPDSAVGAEIRFYSEQSGNVVEVREWSGRRTAP